MNGTDTMPMSVLQRKIPRVDDFSLVEGDSEVVVVASSAMAVVVVDIAAIERENEYGTVHADDDEDKSTLSLPSLRVIESTISNIPAPPADDYLLLLLGEEVSYMCDVYSSSLLYDTFNNVIYYIIYTD